MYIVIFTRHNIMCLFYFFHFFVLVFFSLPYIFILLFYIPLVTSVGKVVMKVYNNIAVLHFITYSRQTTEIVFQYTLFAARRNIETKKMYSIFIEMTFQLTMFSVLTDYNNSGIYLGSRWHDKILRTPWNSR